MNSGEIERGGECGTHHERKNEKSEDKMPFQTLVSPLEPELSRYGITN
jgi:hypothetical protein